MEKGAACAERSEKIYAEAKEWVATLFIVATLVATISFAAAFAIPGGVSSEQGVPVRMRSAALKAFVISNTFALCFSMSALVLCFNVRRTLYQFATDTPLSLSVEVTFYWSNGLVQLALLSTMVSYSSGLYVLVAPSCSWLAITTTTMACAVPFVGILWQLILEFKLMAIKSNNKSSKAASHEHHPEILFLNRNPPHRIRLVGAAPNHKLDNQASETDSQSSHEDHPHHLNLVGAAP